MGCGGSKSSEINQQSNNTEVNHSNEQQRKADESVQKSKENESFIAELVKRHNELRAQHGVEPLTHNPELTAESQKWADSLAKNNKFEHSNTNHGENLWGGSGMSSISGKFSNLDLSLYVYSSNNFKPSRIRFSPTFDEMKRPKLAK